MSLRFWVPFFVEMAVCRRLWIKLVCLQHHINRNGRMTLTGKVEFASLFSEIA